METETTYPQKDSLIDKMDAAGLRAWRSSDGVVVIHGHVDSTEAGAAAAAKVWNMAPEGERPEVMYVIGQMGDTRCRVYQPNPPELRLMWGGKYALSDPRVADDVIKQWRLGACGEQSTIGLQGEAPSVCMLRRAHDRHMDVTTEHSWDSCDYVDTRTRPAVLMFLSGCIVGAIALWAVTQMFR